MEEKNLRKMIDIKKDIKDNDVVVVIFKEDYQKNLMEVTRDLSEQFEKICYINLNKPYDALVESFKKNNININKFSFIDGITSTVKTPLFIKEVRFVSAPNDLTNLNIEITKECRENHPNIFIFDSLSSLLVYEKDFVLIEFVHSVIESLRNYKIKILFTSLDADIDSSLMKDLAMFADKIIKN